MKKILDACPKVLALPLKLLASIAFLGLLGGCDGSEIQPSIKLTNVTEDSMSIDVTGGYVVVDKDTKTYAYPNDKYTLTVTNVNTSINSSSVPKSCDIKVNNGVIEKTNCSNDVAKVSCEISKKNNKNFSCLLTGLAPEQKYKINIKATSPSVVTKNSKTPTEFELKKTEAYTTLLKSNLMYKLIKMNYQIYQTNKLI